jgi:hypothetical protein
MPARSNKSTRPKGALPLKIDAGRWDEGRGVGEEANVEKYMDFATRVVLVCMETIDLAEGEIRRAYNLQYKLTAYEKDYRCPGEILDGVITGFIDSEKFVFQDSNEVFKNYAHLKDFARILKHDPAARVCSHNRDKTQKEYPCISCINDIALNLIGQCDFKRAEELLRQAIYLREKRQHGSERPMMVWKQSHKDFIHGIRDKVEQERRMIDDTSDAAKLLAQDFERVIQQIEIAEKICGKMIQEAEAFAKINPNIDSSQTHKKIESNVSKEAFKDRVEKLAYYQQKYFLLWTRLDLLQVRRRIASQTPALNKLIAKLRVLKYGISDMRRAHDANKGNRQKADELDEDENVKVKQLEELKRLQDEATQLDKDLDAQIEWMVYYDEFDWHVRKNKPIIPLIMPGYFEKIRENKGSVDYNHWWKFSKSQLPVTLGA